MREEIDREFAAALASGKRKKKKVDEYVGYTDQAPYLRDDYLFEPL